MSVPYGHLNNTEFGNSICLYLFQLDFAFLSPFGTPRKPAQIEIAHAFGRAHKVGRSVFFYIELTGSILQHLPTEKAFPLFHLSHRFLT